jgi:hypothetical protein
VKACRRLGAPHARRRGALEIGYWIRASAVGRGYAREATAALARVAIRVCGVDRVEIRVDPANEASLGIPRALGFAEEATLRRRLPAGEGEAPRDAVVFAVFADELDRTPVGTGTARGLRRAGPLDPALGSYGARERVVDDLVEAERQRGALVVDNRAVAPSTCWLSHTPCAQGTSGHVRDPWLVGDPGARRADMSSTAVADAPSLAHPSSRRPSDVTSPKASPATARS